MGLLKRGWVVLASYPFTDLTAVKRRPALVVSASDRPGDDCILGLLNSPLRSMASAFRCIKSASFSSTASSN